MKTSAILGLLIVGLILTMCAVLLPMALYSADYAVDNGTATESTNTTLMVSGVESMWFWGLAILVFILAIGLIFWKFFVR